MGDCTIEKVDSTMTIKIKYIEDLLHNLIVNLNKNRNLACIFDQYKYGDSDYFFYNKNNIGIDEFIRLIYEKTKYNEDLWVGVKPYFVGSENILRIVSENTFLKSKNKILPIYFNNSTKPKSVIQRGIIPPKFILSGSQGESEAIRLINNTAKQNKKKLKAFRCGKIVWDICPCFAVTPDLILVRASKCGYLPELDLDLFNPYILGVTEVKTALTSTIRRPDEITSAKKWIEIARSNGQQQEFCENTDIDYVFKKQPKYVISPSSYEEIKACVKRVRWKVHIAKTHGQKFIKLNSVGVLIKPFTGKVSRQLFSEMLSIAPYVKKRFVIGRLMLVNLIDGGNNRFVYDSCITATLKVPKETLMNIRLGIANAFYTEFLESRKK